jgi:hypothetical protein
LVEKAIQSQDTHARLARKSELWWLDCLVDKSGFFLDQHIEALFSFAGLGPWVVDEPRPKRKILGSAGSLPSTLCRRSLTGFRKLNVRRASCSSLQAGSLRSPILRHQNENEGDRFHSVDRARFSVIHRVRDLA